MRITIGKRPEVRPPFGQVKRTACIGCINQGKNCAGCDYKALYDGADEAIRESYYRQYHAVCQERRDKVHKAISRHMKEKQKKQW